ncbi:hypothetical protein COF09_31485 [Bacillus toyonensis]|uniref:YncE family protein n=1 Tax=Bacillus toyonensis TaxID=155322 RepID=UPI000BFB9E37|nr:YncE family protein [Bacillus toyonensis]PHC35174.1 hypothetical protein COF09_31485 [Bacillus toyonensis]
MSDGATGATGVTDTTGPLELLVNDATNTLYVTNWSLGNVSIVDTLTNAIVSTIMIGPRIDAVALDPTANLLYVAETQNPGNVAVVNLASNTITATIPVGNMASPEAQLNIAVVPSIQRAFVTNVNDGTVSVISTASNSVTGHCWDLP